MRFSDLLGTVVEGFSTLLGLGSTGMVMVLTGRGGGAGCRRGAGARRGAVT
jgi:hypothetical protein